ncbi:MAG: protein-methionine-sulfoxide reductase catalytic subunit MsrP [Hyphomicrobiales bacterium]
MLIKRRKSWEIPENQATPESAYLNRRQLVAAGGLAAGSLVLPETARAQNTFESVLGSIFGSSEEKEPAAKQVDPSAKLYPAKRNEKYKLDRPLTPQDVNESYNNFYEFGSHKRIARASQALKIRPWTVVIDGMVDRQRFFSIDDLLAEVQLEERLYRHRCVEAWSMTIPWSGFPMSEIVRLANPLSKAKYIRMETFHDPEMASGQRATFQPWPYVEGLTIAEAMNELTFMATGAYGKPIAKQHGAPLRLAVPWKYGFKSIKSIVKFTFTDVQPVSFWETLQAREYGFWANVNPDVPHARWSQAKERVLQTGEFVPTQLFNGYGEQVADLYKDIPKSERLFT